MTKLLDFCAPGLILGQAIGRWGNFVNQEAYGNLITDPGLQFFPYGVYIEEMGAWYQATFFYESMWNFGVFIWLLIYSRKAKYDGNVMAMYFIAYGLGRLYIEGLRSDSLYILPGIRVSQVLSLALIIGGVCYILIRRKMKKPNAIYEGPYCRNFKKEGK